MKPLTQRRWLSKKYLIGGCCAGLGVISVFLISQSRSIDFDQYKTYRDAIIRLQRLENTFKQEILKSRYELFASYDPLVQNIEAQEKALMQLNEIPAFIRPDNRRELERLVQQSRDALQQKEDLSEWFKSRNALLKNSLRYLPFLTEQLESSIASQPAESGITSKLNPSEKVTLHSLTNEQRVAIGIPLNQLIRSLLLYSSSGESSLADRIKTLVQSITDLENTLEIPEEQVPTRIFRSHANVILTTKPLVEELTDQLIQAQSSSNIALEETFEDEYRQAKQRTTLFQFLSIIWFGSLLLVGNYILLSRFHQFNLLRRYSQRPLRRLAQMASQIESNQFDEKAMAKLLTYAKRKDALGTLAKSLVPLGEQSHRDQMTLQEESFVMMSSRLSLITKQRQKLLTPEMSEALILDVKSILADFQCHPMEIEIETDQALIKFSYPLTLSLPHLIRTLKQKTAETILQVHAGEVVLRSASEIWSDAYFISSCDVSPPVASDTSRLSRGEVI